jgi:hypothetical protein
VQDPSILVQPNDTSALAGTLARFQVVATSTKPLAYQWLRNGVEIPGATSAQYVFVAGNDLAGETFSVRVSNADSSVVSPAATLSLLTQGTGVLAGSLDQGAGNVDGSVSQARFMGLREMTRDSAGNFYLSDGSSIRKISTDGSVSTYAKNLANPGKMATDKKGNLYVIDGDRILQIDSKGGVTTLANEPGQYLGGIAVDMSDNVVYAVSNGEPTYHYAEVRTCGAIRKISFGVISTVAGASTFPCPESGNAPTDGNGTSAKFASIVALSISSTGSLYTADAFGWNPSAGRSWPVWRIAATDSVGNVTTITTGDLPSTNSLFTQVSGDLYSFNPSTIDKTRGTDCWWCSYDFTRSPNGKDFYAVGHNALLLIRP